MTRSWARGWWVVVGVVGAFLMGAGPAIGAEPRTAVRAAIEAKGAFAFSDGASVYVLEKGGTFVLEPVGISGRTIEGSWVSDDDRIFVVTGRWGWVNGLSRDDDYRRLTFAVTAHPAEGKAEPVKTRSGVVVSPAYFVIDELVKTTKAAFDAAKRASGR